MDLERVRAALADLDATLDRYPDTRPLPAGALDSDAALSALTTPEASMPSRPDQYSAVRLPIGLVDRADRLIPVASRLPDFAAMGSVSRAGVVRVALARGLALLERDAARLPDSNPDDRR